jgi:hypothetical protein
MKPIDIYKIEDLLFNAIEKANIAQDQDKNPEDNEDIECIITGGYPKKGIIVFTTRGIEKRFKITIEEQ